jgi:hypothetical protein
VQRGLLALLSFAVLAAAACGGTLDVGRDVPRNPLLPVDERNPVILLNDGWSDNWSGEYSMLLANTSGPPLVGIIVNADKYWRTLSDNTTGWTNMVMAARSSGLTGIPDPTASAGAQLVKPSDGQIDSTTPNRSAGAQLIVDVSRQLSMPLRPIVVLADGPLTDVADAYLVDPTVVERVVVVAALGSYSAPNGVMSAPNGDLDAWASWIVAQRFRFVQVGVWYDQSNDVSTAQIPSLPMNPFGQWMANKRPKIFTDITTASDQVSALTSGLPVAFVSGAVRAVPDTTGGFDPSKGLPLVPHDGGNIWVVTQTAPPLATSNLWPWLLDPKTFAH